MSEWEEINSNGYISCLKRIKVPGGWIYLYQETQKENLLCFVPTKKELGE